MFGINQIQKRLDELKRELDLIKNLDVRLEIEQLKTQVISLRGLVNRKLGGSIEEPKDKTYKGVISLE
jgi:hypothetical protein